MESSRYASRLTSASSVLPAAYDDTQPDLSGVSGTAVPFPRDLPQEPDDARLTGGTRSLSRRLLALNFPASRLGRIPAGHAMRNSSMQKAKVERSMTMKPGLVA